MAKKEEVKTESEAKAENTAADVSAAAQQLHEWWVKVQLTIKGVNQQDPLLCTWELLPDADKDRYRVLVMENTEK